MVRAALSRCESSDRPCLSMRQCRRRQTLGASWSAMLNGMDPVHTTIEEFATDGYTHIQCYCQRCRVMRLRAISYLPRISMGLTIAQLSARLTHGAFKRANILPRRLSYPT